MSLARNVKNLGNSLCVEEKGEKEIERIKSYHQCFHKKIKDDLSIAVLKVQFVRTDQLFCYAINPQNRQGAVYHKNNG